MSFFTSRQCEYCRTETLWKCRDEHPEWFDGDGQEIENKEIIEYINNNTENKYCVAIDEISEAYCAKHLRTMADMMDEDTGDLKKSKCFAASRTESQSLLIGPVDEGDSYNR